MYQGNNDNVYFKNLPIPLPTKAIVERLFQPSDIEAEQDKEK